jgi:hypothetical protein
MSTNPNFRMIVDHVVEVPKSGMLVRGWIEGGIIQVGDAVQVMNSSPGPTVEVRQISVNGKQVKQANPGTQADLLLIGLKPVDIHPGNRLIPGQKEEAIKLPEEQPWLKLPERIAPLFGFKAFIGSLGSMVFAIIFIAVPIFITYINWENYIHGGIQQNLIIIIVSLGFFAVGGWMLFRSIRGFLQSMHGRRVFQEGNTPTTAHILRRRVVSHNSKYGETYTYHIQVEFNPTLAMIAAGTQQFEAQISKKLYQKLEEAESVQVTYATAEPRIFVVEGE